MNNNSGHISLRAVEKSYFPHHRQEVAVLGGVDLEIDRGETLAIVGASGVGKSTLLHIVGALDRPTKGSVTFGGLDVFSLNDKALAQFRNKKIGFVFQFHHLLPEFNSLENTMMPALVARMGKKEATALATEILAKVGLADRALHKPGELSGGEQQRVALARALALQPEVLLADEPTGNLDEKTGEKIISLVLDLNREKGLTTIVVTHNQAIAERMNRRLTIVNGVVEELK